MATVYAAVVFACALNSSDPCDASNAINTFPIPGEWTSPVSDGLAMAACATSVGKYAAKLVDTRLYKIGIGCAQKSASGASSK